MSRAKKDEKHVSQKRVLSLAIFISLKSICFWGNNERVLADFLYRCAVISLAASKVMATGIDYEVSLSVVEASHVLPIFV